MRYGFRKVSILLAFICLICAMMVLSSCKDNNKNTDNEEVIHIEINSFTVGYLTESAYNFGTYEESAISPTIDLTDGRNGYMIVDFSYTMLEDIGSGKSIMLGTTFPGRGVLDITIEEAATSGIEETESTEGTTLSAKFSIQENAGESKSTRVILRLMPVSGGIVNFRLRLAVDNETNISGTSLIEQSISTGAPMIIYTINPDGKSYSVSGIIDGTTKAIIPDALGDGLPVTSISDKAFMNCTELTDIIIGNNVESIGSSAFQGCTSLTSITIPDSVTSIGDSAFKDCTGLTGVHITDTAKWCNISFSNASANPLYYAHDLYIKGKLVTELIIPEGVTSIGRYAFRGCTSLASITIPKSVTSIDSFVFGGCTSLAQMTVDENNPEYKNIDGNHIYTKDGKALVQYAPGSSSEAFIIPQGVTSIGDDAFWGCACLTDITIPDSVTSIGASAFSGCKKLTGVTIGNGVTSIGASAFSGCKKLAGVTIGNGVISIGNSAFENCTSLTSVTIPDSVRSLGWYAFSGCTSLASIIISNNITSIYGYVFAGCEKLTSVTIGNSVINIDWYSFKDCTSLTSITIPDSVTIIGNSAFLGCTSLTSITIPDSLTSIGDNAFAGCEKLVNLTIPDSVTSIGWVAFAGCTSLTKINYRGTEAQWNAISKGSDWDNNTGDYTITYNYTEE